MAIGDARCCRHSGRQAGDFLQTNCTFAIGASTHAPGYFPRGTENMFTQKPAHRFLLQLYSQLPNLEALKMSFSRRIGTNHSPSKQWNIIQ